MRRLLAVFLLIGLLAPVLLGAGIPDALAIVIFATTQPAVANLGSAVTVQATCSLAILTSRGPARAPAAREAAAQPAASGE